jgi:hypothetical protein
MTMYDVLGDESTVATVAAEPTGENQLPVHGVIFGPGDVTTGVSGKRTRWPAEVLEQMAADGLFEGKPITLADSLDPEQHVGVEMTDDGPALTGAVSMEEKVGEITATEFDADAGLLFEGFLADWEAEETVETGLAQVSPVVMRDIELVEGDPEDGDALYEVTTVGAARDLALVADGAVPSNDIRVGESPMIDATAAEALSAHFGVDAFGDGAGGPGAGDDDPGGGSGQSTPANDDPLLMDLTDKERELVAAARQTDDPTVVAAEVPDRLTELENRLEDYEDLLGAADEVDDPEVVDADEVAAMRERVDIVENLMAEALTERTGLKESTVDAMPFEAMAAEFETDDGDLDVEALTQTPETGSGPSGGGDGGITDDDRERIQQINTKLDAMGSSLPRERAEALREEATDLADADDYDEALEVL